GRWIRIAIVVVTVSVLLRLPLYAAFWLGKPTFDAIALQYKNDPAVPTYGEGSSVKPITPRRAGFYVVTDVHRIPGGLMFYVNGRDDGFAYVPGGTVRGHYNTGDDGYLGGGWWWFAQD